MKKIPKKKRKVTELYFNEYDGIAEIYTYNTKLKKRLIAYAATYPDLCQLTEDDETVACVSRSINTGSASA